MRAVQKCTFIEFESLCQKLWAFMSNFGIFMMPALQIWPCHVTQEANFEKVLFFPNSAANIGKNCKISSRKALYFRSYQPKTSPGGGGKHPPVLLGLINCYVNQFSTAWVSSGLHITSIRNSTSQ